MPYETEVEKLKFLVPSEIPGYLQETYWWAYIHPHGVNLFERQWLVNLILWGNFKQLRDAALAELDPGGKTLQVACVYGNFTEYLARMLANAGTLDVVDILPIQLANLRNKLAGASPVGVFQRNSTALGFVDASYDQVMIFFLLHEQPADVRKETLAEALRVLKPGGHLIVVDYHRPGPAHPLRYLFRPLLRRLEPYALDLWQRELAAWLPEGFVPAVMRKETFYGGLYQKVVITR